MIAERVPNKLPPRLAPRRIAIVSESPDLHARTWVTCDRGHQFASETRDQYGYNKRENCATCGSKTLRATPTPLVGPSGNLLNALLARAGIARDECFVGLICQRQVANVAALTGDEIRDDLDALRNDLANYAPHFILLLDEKGVALRVFSGERRSVDSWRGSLFMSAFTTTPVKCMATYAPRRLIVEASLSGVVGFDLRRVLDESRSDTLDVPVDNIEIDLTKAQLVARLHALRVAKSPVAIDIEGYPNFISCVGFATSSNDAFVVPFIKADNTSYWEDEEDECELWEAIRDVLEDVQVEKWGWNNLYEQFVLPWSYGIVVRNFKHDGMVMWFELNCELEKGLGFVTSILTKHPFYKWERKSKDDRTLLLYNGKDCCRTYENISKMLPMLKPRQHEHYEFNMQLLTPLAFMQLRGIRYDYAKAQARLKAVTKKIYALQDRINREAARHESRHELRALYDALSCYSDLCKRPARVERNDATLGTGDADEVGSRVGGGSQSSVSILLPFLVHAFCKVKRLEKREVELVTWQCRRWNGKKWVKQGARIKTSEEVAALDPAIYVPAFNAPSDKELIWVERVVKVESQNVPAQITSLKNVMRFAKDSEKDACRRAIELVGSNAMGESGSSCFGPAQRGELVTLLGLHVKINASGRDKDSEDDDGALTQGDERDANWLLYEAWSFPKQFKKDGIRLTDKLSSDDEAVIKCWVKTRDRRALWFLQLKKLMTEARNLQARPDEDGRIRCAYNAVGTETCRLTCYGSPTGTSRLNLQTITKSHRVFYRGDDDAHDFCQRDLSASDGYTVAAYAAMLGDTTLLDDNDAKLKPAQILTLMLQGVSVNKLTRDELRPLCKPITEETHWQYFAMKRVQHGCFTEGHELLTPAGWVAIERLNLETEIACYDLHKRVIHFEKPRAITCFPYTGSLYTFEGHSLSLEVTPEHKMPYTTNGNAKWITAEEMHTRKSGGLPTAGVLFNEGLHDANFGALIAAIHSDGCYTSKGYLVFQFKKTRKIKRLRELLARNSLPFKEYATARGTAVFSLTNRAAIAPFKLWGKRASALMLNWSRAAIQSYIDAYAHRDGSIKGQLRQLFAVDKAHLDWIDTFAHLCGMNACYMGERTSGFGSQVHRYSLNVRTFAERGCIKSHVRSVEDVMVYCPTVSTGFVMVRRNGKICASGNSSYLMGKNTMSNQILTDSFKRSGKPVFLEPKKCDTIQRECFFARYPGVARWHAWMEREMREHGALTASNGFTRKFYGRKSETATIGQALSHLPQVYTTYATTLALHKLWHDPENRREGGELRVEPLHTVHDSLLSQWRREDVEWARGKMRDWFNNEILIAQTRIVIPASGSYGASWGEQSEAL